MSSIKIYMKRSKKPLASSIIATVVFTLVGGTTGYTTKSVRAVGLTRTNPIYERSTSMIADEKDDSSVKGSKDKQDPCQNIPNPPGNAIGHDRHCPPEGSSAGVAPGDFNGDGFADLAVGIPNEDIDNVEDAGAVNVIYGSTNGLTEGGGTTGVPVPQFWHQNVDGIPDGAGAFDHFGAALAAGNFNGDGFSDLAIGVPDENIDGEANRGVVHILFGSANGLTANGDQFIEPLGSGIILLGRTNLRFGAALAWGNFNGDHNVSGREVGDLAVGMPGAGLDPIDDCGNVLPRACPITVSGQVAIFLGTDNSELAFAQVVHQEAETVSPLIDTVLVGDVGETEDAFGSVLTAGNFDNDAFDDLVIGVPKEDIEAVTNAGLIHIAFGSADGISNRHLTFSQASTSNADGIGVPNDPVRNNKFGQALAVGDFDDDDLDDLAVGSPFEDVGDEDGAGIVYVLYGENIDGEPGNAEMWHQSVGTIQDAASDTDNFGVALAARDFNADGWDDLAVGVPGEDLSVGGVLQTSAGAVHIIYGTNNGLDDAGNQFFTQSGLGTGRITEGGDQFGSSLIAWNFGRNERRFINGFPVLFQTADLAIGTPGEDLFNSQGINVQDVGAVNVLYGNSINRLSTTGNQLWHQNDPGVGTPNSDEAGDQIEANDRFGATLY